MFDFQDSTFNEVLGFHGQRNTSDNIAALICHGVFERFPNVRVATVESGSDWVAPLLKELDGFSDQEIRMVMRENGLSLVQPPAF